MGIGRRYDRCAAERHYCRAGGCLFRRDYCLRRNLSILRVGSVDGAACKTLQLFSRLNAQEPVLCSDLSVTISYMPFNPSFRPSCVVSRRTLSSVRCGVSGGYAVFLPEHSGSFWSLESASGGRTFCRWCVELGSPLGASCPCSG